MTSYSNQIVNNHLEFLKSKEVKVKCDFATRNTLENIHPSRLIIYKNQLINDFDNIIRIYNFDRELRIICFKAIEIIETSLRSKLTTYLSIDYGNYWHNNQDLFHNTILLEDHKNKISKTLLRNYKSVKKIHQYNSFQIFEITSFSLLSQIYGNLKNSIKVKKTIARSYNIPNHYFLESWLKSIAEIRNICAHHKKLFNTKLPTPLILTKTRQHWITNPNKIKRDSLYLNLCCIKYLLNQINQNDDIGSELLNLIKRYSHLININQLGFTPNWQQQRLWA